MGGDIISKQTSLAARQLIIDIIDEYNDLKVALKNPSVLILNAESYNKLNLASKDFLQLMDDTLGRLTHFLSMPIITITEVYVKGEESNYAILCTNTLYDKRLEMLI